MTVRPLRLDESAAVLDLAARAFFDDPLFVHLYPDPARRRRDFAVEHAAYLCHHYRPYGVAEVAEVGGALAGMALWMPPGAEVPLWRELASLPALVRAVGWRRVGAVLEDYRAFDAHAPEEPHWYLGILAVAPETQGQGVGGALVRAGLARADRDGVGTFLETGTDTNVAIYRRLGFEPRQTISLPHGPPHTAMWRPPTP